MTRLDPNRLPLNEVDHPKIRQPAEEWHQAQGDLRAAQQAVGRLDGGRLRAREADAEEAAIARRAGKPGTARKHEAAFDKQLDGAEHDQRVAQALVRQTREAYQAALDLHADDWREQLDADAHAADELWMSALSALAALHEQRTKAHTRRRMLGADGFPAGAIRLKPEQLSDSVTGSKLELARLDDAAQRYRQRAVARIDDVLAALQVADVAEHIEPMAAFRVADQLAQAFEHAQTVDRGYSIDEAHGVGLGAVADRPHVNGVPVYMPTGRGEQ